MKNLRTLILINAVIFLVVGIGMALFPYVQPRFFRPFEEIPMLRCVGVVLGAFGLVIWSLSGLSLPGERRRLAFRLSIADLLIAGLAGLPITFEGKSVAGILLFLPVIAGVLAWTAWQSGGIEEIAEALPIPDEVRQSWLRQIGEAAVQEERNRLARDLHDSIKQQLFTVNVSTAAAQELWEQNPERAKAALVDVRRSAREAMVEMQDLLHQLQPQALAAAGLVEALREQCEALGYRTGAEVSLELGEAIPDERLPPGAQETLFRIAQEALANVARHARARKVRVWLGREEDQAVLRVEDDGQGFDPESARSGMGLRNLRERAESLRGTLEVRSTPGSGSAISVRVPFSPVPLRLSPIENALLAAKQELLFGGLPFALFFWLLRPIVNERLSYLDLGFAVLCVLFIFPPSAADIRRRTKFVLETSPDMAPAAANLLLYRSSRNRDVFFLTASWWAPWWWQFDSAAWERIWSVAWLVASAVWAVLTIAELVRLHHTSELRTHFEFRQWRGFDLALTIGILLGFLVFLYMTHSLRPEPLAPLEMYQLLFGAAVLGYLLTRQPRTEAAK